MTLRLRSLLFLIIPCMIALTPEASSAPCSADQFLGSMLGVKNETKEWLAKTFQKQNIKDFDPNKYFQAKNEYLSMKDAVVPPPPLSEFEKYTAWVETKLEPTTHALPTVDDVLQHGSELQKRKLSQWMNRYSKTKLTEKQTLGAAQELSLILNDLHFDISSLHEFGAQALAEKMVRTQFQENLIYQQLRTALKENGLLRDEVLLDQLKNLAASTTAKFGYFGSVNAYFASRASSWGNLLMITLPDLKIVKLSMNDLRTLLQTEKDTAKFEEAVTRIAAQYHGKVKTQAIYETFRSTVTDISYVLWVKWAINKIHEHHSYENKLDKKNHS